MCLNTIISHGLKGLFSLVMFIDFSAQLNIVLSLEHNIFWEEVPF